MEMHLQPQGTTCFVSGEPFVDGARVASYLVRVGAAMEIVRYDVLETHVGGFTPEGQVACRWVHPFKRRKEGENQDKALKLTAENLFVTLADPQTEPTPENTRLVQFLALMLERKKILKPKGRSKDGARNLFEHAKTKQIFEVPAGELTPEFFVAVQEQLSVLVGAPKAKTAEKAAGAEAKGEKQKSAEEKPAEEKAAEEKTAASETEAVAEAGATETVDTTEPAPEARG